MPAIITIIIIALIGAFILIMCCAAMGPKSTLERNANDESQLEYLRQWHTKHRKTVDSTQEKR